MNRGLILALLFVALSAPASAQLPDSLSDVGRIYVLTTVPGDEIYSRYGHTAIRVHDRGIGLDVTFNYGTFDFREPGFVWKFAHGELDYYLDVTSTRRAVQSARLQGRTLRQQLLDLGKDHRDRIYTALLENAKPENRTYRYDFLFDNCGTRPRDIIERMTDRAIEWGEPGSAESFRELLDPYHAAVPAIDLGTDLVLGSDLDVAATPPERAFLPLELEHMLNDAWVSDDVGRRPLVLVHDTLFAAERPEMPARGFPWPTLLSSLVALLGLFQLRKNRGQSAGSFDRILLGLLGLVGTFLLYMGTMTAHSVTDANFNLLWALPTHLIAAFAIGRLRPRVAGGYLMLSAALAALSLLGGFLLPQPLPMAMVPLVVMISVRFGVVGRRLLRAGV